MDWQALLKYIVTALAGSGLLYAIVRTLGQRFIEHAFHSREQASDQRHSERLQEITLRHQEQLKELEHQFALLEHREAVRFAAMHPERVHALIKVFDNLIDLEGELYKHLRTSEHSPDMDKRDTVFETFWTSMTEKRDFYYRHKFYFEPKTCDLVEDVYRVIGATENDVSSVRYWIPQTLYGSENNEARKQIFDKFNDAHRRMQTELKAALSALQEEIRVILGVTSIK